MASSPAGSLQYSATQTGGQGICIDDGDGGHCRCDGGRRYSPPLVARTGRPPMQNTAVAQLFARAAGHAADFRAGLPKQLQRPAQTYAEALAGFETPTPEAGTEAQIVL